MKVNGVMRSVPEGVLLQEIVTESKGGNDHRTHRLAFVSLKNIIAGGDFISKTGPDFPAYGIPDYGAPGPSPGPGPAYGVPDYGAPGPKE